MAQRQNIGATVKHINYQYHLVADFPSLGNTSLIYSRSFCMCPDFNILG